MDVAHARVSSAFLGLALASWFTIGVAAPSCGGGAVVEEEADGGTDGGAGPVVETLKPNADPLPGETECSVVMTTGIPVGPAIHVPYCTEVEYATNPPSGGDHWQQWAAFKEYSSAIRREIYVHDLEHGAVVLAYKCEAECPQVVQMLRDVVAGAASDPLCVELGGPPARFVITPDPMLDTPIAAAAWGATYTATCIDKASLAKFVAAVYGSGPEAICFPGKDPMDPNSGIPACDGSTGN
ncbi:MAG TPA: DUF3105 domain-containing protein [Polyangiaceae bacterium]|jgi:hypothetical protein|nr:DUF3105 domain-containing protein [Polyangiaceae bacterium]